MSEMTSDTTRSPLHAGTPPSASRFRRPSCGSSRPRPGPPGPPQGDGGVTEEGADDQRRSGGTGRRSDQACREHRKSTRRSATLKFGPGRRSIRQIAAPHVQHVGCRQRDGQADGITLEQISGRGRGRAGRQDRRAIARIGAEQGADQQGVCRPEDRDAADLGAERDAEEPSRQIAERKSDRAAERASRQLDMRHQRRRPGSADAEAERIRGSRLGGDLFNKQFCARMISFRVRDKGQARSSRSSPRSAGGGAGSWHGRGGAWSDRRSPSAGWRCSGRRAGRRSGRADRPPSLPHRRSCRRPAWPLRRLAVPGASRTGRSPSCIRHDFSCRSAAGG